MIYLIVGKSTFVIKTIIYNWWNISAWELNVTIYELIKILEQTTELHSPNLQLCESILIRCEVLIINIIHTPIAQPLCVMCMCVRARVCVYACVQSIGANTLMTVPTTSTDQFLPKSYPFLVDQHTIYQQNFIKIHQHSFELYCLQRVRHTSAGDWITQTDIL